MVTQVLGSPALEVFYSKSTKKKGCKQVPKEREALGWEEMSLVP